MILTHSAGSAHICLQSNEKGQHSISSDICLLRVSFDLPFALSYLSLLIFLISAFGCCLFLHNPVSQNITLLCNYSTVLLCKCHIQQLSKKCGRSRWRPRNRWIRFSMRLNVKNGVLMNKPDHSPTLTRYRVQNANFKKISNNESTDICYLCTVLCRSLYFFVYVSEDSQPSR